MDEEQCPEAHDISVACWEVLLPRVWELSRLDSIMTLILMWKGWLGPCHWETSETRAVVVPLHPLLKRPLLDRAVHLSPQTTWHGVWAMWSAVSGGRWSKLQSSLFGGLETIAIPPWTGSIVLPLPRPDAQGHTDTLYETQHRHAFACSFSPSLCWTRTRKPRGV